MEHAANAMQIFNILPKTNCRKCNETTCLAFASKVFLGQKSIELCPFVEDTVINAFKGRAKAPNAIDQYQQEMIRELKMRLGDCDLKAAAVRTGGSYADNRLMLRIFGKPFYVDDQGNLFSDIHVNPWITSTVLGYILHCKGVPLKQQWVPFRELKGGREKNGLFVQRSQSSFKRIADQYTGFFEDLIHLFNGKKTDSQFDSDISLVLEPLPRLPILICYWKAAEGMDSDLNLLFDASADDNANIDIVYNIAAGIVVMFEKIALRHGG